MMVLHVVVMLKLICIFAAHFLHVDVSSLLMSPATFQWSIQKLFVILQCMIELHIFYTESNICATKWCMLSWCWLVLTL